MSITSGVYGFDQLGAVMLYEPEMQHFHERSCSDGHHDDRVRR
jgi:hypothetical protein